MPNVLLSVPHFEQSGDGQCLPACVRMVLAFWGDERTETVVAKQLGTKQFGLKPLAVQVDGHSPLTAVHNM